MKPYTTLLIDDEKLAVKRLARLLENYAETIKVTGEAFNGLEGQKLIEQLKPELIFLDIEMPVLNGFEMLAQLQYMPVVVFVTAFEAYAIRAFEENSIDYLLKPVEKERLQLTVEKLKKLKVDNKAIDYNQQLFQAIEQLKPRKELISIPVKMGDRILLIRLEEIVYFEAEDKYVYLHTLEDKKYLIDNSLSSLEEKLPVGFIRTSRSVIINQHYVKEIQKYFSGRYVLLMNNKAQSKITTGLSYADKVRALLEI
jgi:two-component system LytT family response regulator